MNSIRERLFHILSRPSRQITIMNRLVNCTFIVTFYLLSLKELSFEHLKCLELIDNTFGKMKNNSSVTRTEQLALRYHKAKLIIPGDCNLAL